MYGEGANVRTPQHTGNRLDADILLEGLRPATYDVNKSAAATTKLDLTAARGNVQVLCSS